MLEALMDTSVLRETNTDSQLRMRRVWRIIQRLFFLFLNENICCDPSLESSRRDDSNGGSQHTFSKNNMENYP